MPVNAPAADTIHTIDTVESHYYVPQYPDGFPASQEGDSVLQSINTLPVMEQPARAKAQPFERSPLHDTASMSLLLAGLMAVAFSYHTGYKYIENFFHYMFSTRRRENLFEDHTVNETKILAALVANTCIVEGLLMYFAIALFKPALAPSLQSGVFLHIASFTGLALGFYIVQWLVFKVMGYTFGDKVSAKLWIDGFKATQAFLGLLLLPVAVLVMVYPTHGKLLLSIAAGLYLTARLIFVCKGIRIFYSNLSSIIYFILYLCAVEIVPLVIMTGVTIWLCGTLQS